MASKGSGIDELRNMLAARDKKGKDPPKYPNSFKQLVQTKPLSGAPQGKGNGTAGSSGEDLTQLLGMKADLPLLHSHAQDTSAAFSSFPTPDNYNSSSSQRAVSNPASHSVPPPSSALNYAELQSAANSVRKELAQTGASFLNKTQGGGAGGGPLIPSNQAPSRPPPSKSYYHSSGYHESDSNGVTPSGLADNLKSMDYMRDAGRSSGSTWSSREEASEDLIGMPPQRRAEKAMQYVKFWQRSGVTASALQFAKSPTAFAAHLVQTWKQNEMTLNPTYVVLFLLGTILLSWNYLHPTGMPWRPDGLFYYHNTAYDSCVSHYRMCAKGLYTPEAVSLKMDAAALYVPGRGGPLNSCTSAAVLMLLSDEYLPAVLTSLHMLRKYARVPIDYVVVVTPAVSEEARQVLYQSCVIVRTTQVVENPWANDPRHKKEDDRKPVEPMDRGRKDMMTKIMIWALDEYDQAVYVDSDSIILRSFDSLFELGVQHGQLYAPARSYSDPQHFGAYLMAIHPSMDTVKQMMRLFAEVKEPDRKKEEGDFLNDFFSDSWLGNPEHRLPWGLFTVASDLSRSPRLVLEHVNKTAIGFKFVGNSAQKPWLKGMVTYKDDPELMYFQKLWWKQYYEMTDRALPATIDMYSLLELSEYDLYWKQMYSPLTPRKWMG